MFADTDIIVLCDCVSTIKHSCIKDKINAFLDKQFKSTLVQAGLFKQFRYCLQASNAIHCMVRPFECLYN